MDLEIYNEDHKIFRDGLRKFLEKEMVVFNEEAEKTGLYPREAWKKLGEAGYLCTWLDEKYGGSGADWAYSLIINEELSRANVHLSVNLHSDVVAPYIDAFGSEELKQKWLPGAASGDILFSVGMTEPNAGSDLQQMRATAVKDGDDYIINGNKVFITNGIYADVIVLACKTDPKAVPTYRGVSLIAVEVTRPGFSRRKLKTMAAMSDTAELFFEDVRVPQTNLIGEEGKGFIYLMHKLQQERIVSTHLALILGEQMLEQTIEYAKSRVAFGQPIIKFQHNTFKVVEMATEMELGKCMLNKLIVDHMAGKDVVRPNSMLKWWAAEMVQRLLYNCLQLHGGYGFMDEYPISRAYRGSRAMTIAAGT
ncbi:MAG: acyl-CoA dehydrogenase family protein, partial [Bacillota bacterium]